jgi:poly-beta-1,6-N-acetyl-D-glucosamine synthase
MEIQGSLFQYITLLLLIAALTVQLVFWLRFYLSASSSSLAEPGQSSQPVSVVICARNESANLREYLPAVLEQDYPAFEVIVVNDCSDDDSDLVLSELRSRYSNLKISTIHKDPRFHHNKKLAQLIGIKAAANEILLFTDADCRPESDQWLRLMTSHLSGNRDFVLGYGGYLSGRGLLNKYVRYDTMFIAMQYLGMALRGRPYMGVGRNLAYRKSLFMNRNNFSSHYHIASGDDDLFVNANATAGNTSVETGPGSRTWSVPVNSFSALMKQKRRHMTTAAMYKLRDRVLLFAEPFSRLLFYSAAVVLLVQLYLWPVISALILARFIVMLVVLDKAANRLGEKGLTMMALFFDILAPFINSLFYLSSFGKRQGSRAWR